MIPAGTPDGAMPSEPAAGSTAPHEAGAAAGHAAGAAVTPPQPPAAPESGQYQSGNSDVTSQQIQQPLIRAPPTQHGASLDASTPPPIWRWNWTWNCVSPSTGDQALDGASADSPLPTTWIWVWTWDCEAVSGNTAISIRILSPGDDGSVSQTVSAASQSLASTAGQTISAASQSLVSTVSSVASTAARAPVALEAHAEADVSVLSAAPIPPFVLDLGPEALPPGLGGPLQAALKGADGDEPRLGASPQAAGPSGPVGERRRVRSRSGSPASPTQPVTTPASPAPAPVAALARPPRPSVPSRNPVLAGLLGGPMSPERDHRPAPGLLAWVAALLSALVLAAPSFARVVAPGSDRLMRRYRSRRLERPG